MKIINKVLTLKIATAIALASVSTLGTCVLFGATTPKNSPPMTAFSPIINIPCTPKGGTSCRVNGVDGICRDVSSGGLIPIEGTRGYLNRGVLCFIKGQPVLGTGYPITAD